MPELTVVMTYHLRKKQLLKTLSSFTPNDFDVVIVDDSPEDLELPQYNFDVSILKVKQKNWINPCVNFNIGFDYALKNKPRVIIIQNAECYHKGDVIGYAIKNTKENNYITFAAYSLAGTQDVDLKILNKKMASGNGDSGWYNHSRYRPTYLHFCSAITSGNLRKINGFDERFALGLGWEDNYLIHQVDMLGLKKLIIDNPFVFHQYHYSIPAFKWDQSKYDGAKRLCRQLTEKKEYRAEHLITPDL